MASSLVPPWFKRGLRFTCTQCGACCTGEPGQVWVTHDEIKQLAELLGCSLKTFGTRYLRRVGVRIALKEKMNGDCIFFERPSGHCLVYAIRPTQCRTYPFWPEVLRSPRTWDDERDYCPGIGSGKQWSADRCAELVVQSRRATARTARSFPRDEAEEA